MKTKEELAELKKEYEELNGKLKELTKEQLEEVTGGAEEHNVMVGAEQKEYYVGKG